MSKILSVFAVVCALFQSGCGEAGPNIDLENVVLVGNDGVSLEIDSDPLFHIVSVDHSDGPIYLQYITDAAFVGNHVALSISVGNSGWLAVIDEAGRSRVIGRPGNGPGEFARTPRLFSSANALVAWDQGNGRLTRYSQELELISEYRWERARGTVVGVLRDGHIVTTPFGSWAVQEGEARTYDISSLEGDVVGQLAGPLEPPLSNIRIRLSSTAVSGAGANFGSLACFPEILHTVVGETVVIADSQNGTVYSSEDARGISPVISQLPLPVSQGMLNAVEDRLRRSVMAGQDRIPAIAEEDIKMTLARIGNPGEPLPSTWSKILVDRDSDQVWLRKATCMDGSRNEVWDVVDLSQGSLIAQAEFPANMQLLAVDRSRALVSIVDAMDVRSVALFRTGPED